METVSKINAQMKHNHEYLSFCSPPLRTHEDVKELASLIAHFPSLLPPDASSLVLESIASRAVAESVRDRHGFACECIEISFAVSMNEISFFLCL